jgi:hypothetical protein
MRMVVQLKVEVAVWEVESFPEVIPSENNSEHYHLSSLEELDCVKNRGLLIVLLRNYFPFVYPLNNDGNEWDLMLDLVVSWQSWGLRVAVAVHLFHFLQVRMWVVADFARN